MDQAQLDKLFDASIKAGEAVDGWVGKNHSDIDSLANGMGIIFARKSPKGEWTELPEMGRNA